MAQFVIYRQSDRNNEIAIVIPTGELPIAVVAQKDVPAGVPYLIVSDTDLPHPDWSYSAAWEGDFSQPHGVGVGADEWFAQKATEDMTQRQVVAEQENVKFDATQAIISKDGVQ